MADKLLTFRQVAEYYAVTTRTVRNWADKGAVPVVRTPTGQPRVPAAACGSETRGNTGK